MDVYFETILSWQQLSKASARQLVEDGFLIIPDVLSGQVLTDLAAAYDEVMANGSGPDFKVASTTTRMFDLVNRGPAFDSIYVYQPLLEACGHVIGAPFKLSSLLGRTLRAKTPAQDLHADLPRNSEDAPMVGFIVMLDPFTADNGATRFVPGSHNWIDLPGDRISNLRSDWPGEILACGNAGSIIVFNGAIWHGHTANMTSHPRRSIQGYFVRRDAGSGINFSGRMLSETLDRISPLARYLLALQR